MDFNSYLEQARHHDLLKIDASWGQGRTTFGGLSTALLLQRIAPQVDSDHILSSLSVNFCGPLHTETDFSLSTSVLRQGKSVAHFQGLVSQNNELVTVVNACYTRSRASAVVVEPSAAIAREVAAGQKLPYIKNVTPEFTKHIDFIYSEGGLPFSGSKHNHLHGWMRFNTDLGQLTNAHLVALIDAWPPTLLQKMRAPAPCASVTWSLEFITPLSALPNPIRADQWLRYDATIAQAGNGYGHTEARIYSDDGTLLALSRQLVTIYDQR